MIQGIFSTPMKVILSFSGMIGYINNMALKLIIFDLDGTLVDSSIDICHAINYALEGMNVPPITVRETIAIIGEGITRLFEKIIEIHNIPADKEFLIKRFLDHYAAHLVDNTTVYPGVEEALKSLNGCRKAVISNKREDFSERVLELLGLRKYFDLVVGSDTTAERKPSPVPIQYVLSRFETRSEEAIIVGDSNYDIDAGNAAGITTIAVTYGYRPLNLLKRADYIIDTMPELLRIVEELSPANRR
jgi:phosphoglycolate phosphatase